MQWARRGGLDKVNVAGIQLDIGKVGIGSGKTIAKALAELSDATNHEPESLRKTLDDLAFRFDTIFFLSCFILELIKNSLSKRAIRYLILSLLPVIFIFFGRHITSAKVEIEGRIYARDKIVRNCDRCWHNRTSTKLLSEIKMVAVPALLGFSLVALGMVITPGPNMMYLVSRSICQGRNAGLISLGGVASAFIVYMFASALGITALLLAVPFAYDVLRFAGAAYLLYMAWQALRPGGRSPFQVRDLAQDSPRRLYAMGFMTNLLNPKAAMLYLSLLPQFIDPQQGSVLGQAITLGSVQIIISVTVNALIACAAGSIAGFLGTRPTWLKLQRWLMGTMLAGLALRMVLDGRK